MNKDDLRLMPKVSMEQRRLEPQETIIDRLGGQLVDLIDNVYHLHEPNLITQHVEPLKKTN